MKELILGGARSGKSEFAGICAETGGMPVTCVVTAQPNDREMSTRIRHHREKRPAHWKVVEEPVSLAATLKAMAAPEQCLLVDCLTLWLSNLLHADQDDSVAEAGDSMFVREREALVVALPALAGHIILVSNEVGMGIVPLGELSRRFSDEAGRLHQDLARLCDRVTLMAGIGSQRGPHGNRAPTPGAAHQATGLARRTRNDSNTSLWFAAAKSAGGRSSAHWGVCGGPRRCRGRRVGLPTVGHRGDGA
jgi:adenosylcobinamide kinase / adenosylcobinamide-phosphate guanylyltransferase